MPDSQLLYRNRCVTVADGDVINDILTFCQPGVDNRDLLPLGEYKADQQRLIGHQPGIARAKLANRAARQTAHICAGLAQFLARRYGPGVVDDGDIDKIEDALACTISSMIEACRYEIGEFYFFRHPALKPGMEPLNGCIIENCAEIYPDFWQYIQTVEGSRLCITEAEWQELSAKIYYTAADGTTFGYNGVGGVTSFAPDFATGNLHNPDLRGMHLEAAGFDSLSVPGSVDIDRMRDIQGHFMPNGMKGGFIHWRGTGVFSPGGIADTPWFVKGNSAQEIGDDKLVNFAPSRVAPTGPVMAPRRVAVLACAYMGMPAL